VDYSAAAILDMEECQSVSITHSSTFTFQQRGDSTRHTLPPEFPSDALMSDLVELYFTRENIYLPVLHRPTFERGVAEGLHLRRVFVAI
jgi:hypothetical protein